MNRPSASQEIAEIVPDDLVPLSRVAGFLRVSTADRKKAALKEQFPKVYEPIPGRLRVSLSDVEEHFLKCDLISREAIKKFRIDFVKSRSARRVSESRQRA